jgi:hypothetical protein
MTKVPLLFLDTVGTMFTGAAFGPLAGVSVGLATNLVQGVMNNPKDIPFALDNMAVGLSVGLVAQRGGFTYGKAFWTGLLLAVVCPLIGTPIAIWIYGGITGGGLDFLFAWLLKSGSDIFTAAFLPRIRVTWWTRSEVPCWWPSCSSGFRVATIAAKPDEARATASAGRPLHPKPEFGGASPRPGGRGFPGGSEDHTRGRSGNLPVAVPGDALRRA